VAPLLVPLYVLFFTVQFGWDLVRWTFAGTANALGLAARKILVFLLTYGLLIMLPLWLPAILAGWEWLGRTATGLPGLSPSSIFEQGLSLALSMFDSFGEIATLALAPVGTFRTLAALIVLVAFGAAALQLARVLVEASVALGGLVVLLVFAGLSITFGLAEGYLRYVLDIGVRAYVVYLLVAVGSDLGAQWDDVVTSSSVFDLRLHLAILLGAVFFALLVWTLPRTISQHVGGGVSFAGLNPMGDRG
jgi:P-type conjugative transfer protein TrbL